MEKPESHPRFFPLPSNISSITKSWNLLRQASQIHSLLSKLRVESNPHGNWGRDGGKLKIPELPYKVNISYS